MPILFPSGWIVAYLLSIDAVTVAAGDEVYDRRYRSLLGNDTENRIAPVGEAGRIGEGTDLDGIGRPRREPGDGRGWTGLSDQLRDRRPRGAVDGGHATKFVRGCTVNGHRRHVNLAAVLALCDLANG